MKNELRRENHLANMTDLSRGTIRQFNKTIVYDFQRSEKSRSTDYVITSTTVQYPYTCFAI